MTQNIIEFDLKWKAAHVLGLGKTATNVNYRRIIYFDIISFANAYIPNLCLPVNRDKVVWKIETDHILIYITPVAVLTFMTFIGRNKYVIF